MTAHAITDPDIWRNHAACLDADPEIFYTNGDWKNAPHREAAAKAWCKQCPALNECLDDALDKDDRFAIRGGMTPDERAHHKRRIRRRKPINHGTDNGWEQHRRRGERPCQPCGDAHSRARRDRAARRKSRAVS